MLIIYIALVCIVCGIVFLVKSTQTERVKLSELDRREAEIRVQQRSRPAADSIKSFRTEEFAYHTSLPDPVAEMSVQSTTLHEPPSASVKHPSGDVVSNEPISHSVSKTSTVHANELSGVLFEDPDSVINFSRDGDTIPADTYKNLKRIGAGGLTLGAESLTLRIEKTMYRFDFNRIKEIRGDKNGVLLYPDNITYPLLLIVPALQNFSTTILTAYNEFKKL